jgi:aldose 1-epimerase
VLGLQNAPRHRLLLGLSSPDDDEGYPGNLDVTVEFTVEGNELRLELEAQSDQPTPLNLTYHPYFNLGGDMRLRIPASQFLPVKDSQMIPTGQRASVEGTPFDFRSSRSVVPPAVTTHPQLTHAGGYDHCWILDPARDCDAELHSASSGVRMTVRSDRPGLQFYGGQHLGPIYPELAGICLEPEGFPNAVNEPSFPPCILEAGVIHRSTISYLLEELS